MFMCLYGLGRAPTSEKLADLRYESIWFVTNITDTSKISSIEQELKANQEKILTVIATVNPWEKTQRVSAACLLLVV